MLLSPNLLLHKSLIAFSRRISINGESKKSEGQFCIRS
ncbi:unnamed protein product [Rhodiola kirilowii]